MSPLSSVRAARVATCLVFLICGIGMAAWTPMVPYAKARLGLDDATLGLVLLALGGGAIVTMPLSGLLINRLGSRAVMLGAILLLSAMLPLLALADRVGVLAVCLFFFGGGIGAVDVAMNAQAVVVERRLARPVMSSFHGLFSVGGLAGALGFSALLEHGFSLTVCATGAAALCVGLGLLVFPRLLPRADDARVQGARLSLPRGPVIVLGALCFITFLAEGALLDWSAVFLKFSRGFSEASAGVGFAVFSLTMSVARLTGDAVVHNLGPVRTLRLGALVGAAGYFLAVGVPSPALSLTGFALIGLGIANVIPLLFSAAGRLGDPSVTLPAITTMGYTGLLVGPALIGGIGQLTSLSIALGAIGVSLLIVAASARRVQVSHSPDRAA